MSVIAPGSLVLVSGASGFVAAHVCQQLVERGFKVRGTVRSDAKGHFLEKLLGSNFSYVIVEDVETTGAFDEACKGVDAVLHTASPFHFNVTDPHKDLIDPAIKGTVNMLASVAKNPKITRVVITSSYASVVRPTPQDPTYQFTETDWNDFSPAEVARLGNKVDGFTAYRASKSMAERAAWQYQIDNNSTFSITCINPPFVFGPIIHQCDSAESLNTSVAAFYRFLTGNKANEDAILPSGSFVDVRDVAKLHIESMLVESAANKRFLVSNSSFSYQPLLDVVHANADLLASFPTTVRGIPGSPAPVQQSIDTTLARQTFNWTPIAMEQTVIDMTLSLIERQKAWGSK